MRNVFLAELAFFVLAAAPVAQAQAPAGALTIRFPALATVGQVQVALFASEAAWKTRRDALRTATLKAAGDDAVEARFDDLPPGRYGVMAYHDRNGNGRLDTLPIGLPTEPYGFSNDARGTFGPPSWRAAAVSVTAGEAKALSIRLR